jgi:hypothetical protein
MDGTDAWIKRQRRFMIQPRVGDEGAYPGFGKQALHDPEGVAQRRVRIMVI